MTPLEKLYRELRTEIGDIPSMDRTPQMRTAEEDDGFTPGDDAKPLPPPMPVARAVRRGCRRISIKPRKGEIQVAEFCRQEGARLGVTPQAIRSSLERGHYPTATVRRVNGMLSYISFGTKSGMADRVEALRRKPRCVKPPKPAGERNRGGRPNQHGFPPGLAAQSRAEYVRLWRQRNKANPTNKTLLTKN